MRGDERLARGERLVQCHVVHFVVEGSGFQPRVIQHAVDQPRQVPLAALDALEVGTLLRRDWTVDPHLDQVGVAGDRVQRCPELVAHHREKLALRPVGRLGGGLRRRSVLPGLDGLHVEPGVVDGQRRAAGQILGEEQVQIAEAPTRFHRHEGHRADDPTTRHHGRDDVRADAELAEESKVLGVVRAVAECSVRYVEHHLRPARADHAWRAEQVVRMRRVALVERTRESLLGRIRVEHGEAPDALIADAHVYDAPCAEVGERHAGDGREGRLVVERLGEAPADLRQEREAVAARLGGVALALGDPARRPVTSDIPDDGRLLFLATVAGVADQVVWWGSAHRDREPRRRPGRASVGGRMGTQAVGTRRGGR